MKIPATDDLLLFGSLVLAALGAALVTGASTDNPILALGVALLVFGLPSLVIIFMAAGESE